MTDEIRTNTIFVGRYQMQRELGRGGMGSVYLAFDMQFRKPVAIKVARLAGPEARAQFRREALYLQRLRHHNLPQVLDIFSDTQRDFLVMEYIPGDDLEARVQQQGPQPEWLVLRWADELLDVLDYLHTQTPPIIHRDIKPGNLKLRQNDTLVLVDFGIAAEHRPEETEFVGATAVTPGFSPPEQYTDSPADARSDVYSAGATLYYLLTGVIPAAAPERASNEAALAPVRKLASKTSANTDALLSKALNLASEERWANAAEMRRAAVVAARKLASMAAPAAPPEPASALPAAGQVRTAPRRSKRSLGLAGAAALLSVALLAVAALLWTASNRQPSAAALPEQAAMAAVEPSPMLATSAPPATIAPTPTLTAAAADLATDTASATELSQPVGGGQPATQVPTSTPTSTPTILTSTPIHTRTPTPVAGAATATVTPSATQRSGASTSGSSRTPTPTATISPTATPKPAATATSAPAMTIALQEPAAGAVGGGERLFRWQASQGLSGNQAFELAFWRPGQDALRDSFGPVGVTQQASGGMRINLDEADVLLGALLDPGDYLWGVLLVETEPYRRVALLSEARAFRFERSGGGGGQAAPQEPQQPTPPPPPPTLVP